VNLNRGRAVHYPCRPEHGFVPDPEEIESLITKRTRAIVVINPNNPTGAVYPRAVLEAIARIAEKHHLVVLADEIYERLVYGGAAHTSFAAVEGSAPAQDADAGGGGALVWILALGVAAVIGAAAGMWVMRKTR